MVLESCSPAPITSVSPTDGVVVRTTLELWARGPQREGTRDLGHACCADGAQASTCGQSCGSPHGLCTATVLLQFLGKSQLYCRFQVTEEGRHICVSPVKTQSSLCPQATLLLVISDLLFTPCILCLSHRLVIYCLFLTQLMNSTYVSHATCLIILYA